MKKKYLISIIYTAIALMAMNVFAECNVFRKEKRPNILFIVTEDNGNELGCYGASVKTPNLDKLASIGTQFENAYVPQAGCSPSRAAFLTGLYPHQNGQIGLASWRYHMYKKNTPNLVNDLKRSGYRTGNIGKIHVNPESAFDFDMWEIHKGNFKRQELDNYAEVAEQFFQASDKPFYLQVNYPDAHRPYISQVDGMPSEVLTGNEVEAIPYFGLSSPKLRQLTADYYNSIMRFDDMIGELVDRLKASGKYENTLIVYIGDHGADMLRGKRTCYEGGVKIPLIISWPKGGEKGVVYKGLASTIDLYPTFMEVSGNPIRSYLPGKSLLPVIKGDKSPVRKYLFTEYHVHSNHNPYPQRAVRDERFKLIHNLVAGHENPGVDYTIGKKIDSLDFIDALTRTPKAIVDAYNRMQKPPEYELYDLKNDPFEWNNLAGNPEYSAILEKMKKELHDWQKTTNDPMIDQKKAERFFLQIMNLNAEKTDVQYDYLDPKLDFK